jgi:hypothetical protein
MAGYSSNDIYDRQGGENVIAQLLLKQYFPKPYDAYDTYDTTFYV